jgi:hypothetical protein
LRRKREKLRSFGGKGETYDEVLRRPMTIAEYEKSRRDSANGFDNLQLHNPSRRGCLKRKEMRETIMQNRSA